MAIKVRIPWIELILALWVTWSEMTGCSKEQLCIYLFSLQKFNFPDLSPKPFSTQVGNTAPGGYAIMQGYSRTSHHAFSLTHTFFFFMPLPLARSLIRLTCKPVPVHLYFCEKLMLFSVVVLWFIDSRVDLLCAIWHDPSKDSAHGLGGIILEKPSIGLQPWAPAVLLCRGEDLKCAAHKCSFSATLPWRWEAYCILERAKRFWRLYGLLTLISSGVYIALF